MDDTNKLLADLLKHKHETQRLPWIICGVVIVIMAVTFAFIHHRTMSFFSEYEFYYEESWVVDQQQSPDGGNNIYTGGGQYIEQQNATIEEGK